MRFYTFTVQGKVYAGNEAHAKHSVYWALRNSEYDDELLEINVEIEETK